MKLKLYARPGYLLSTPGPKVTGTTPQYMGRKLEVEGERITNPAIQRAIEVDPATSIGKRVLRVMLCDGADYPLWPADQETARVCGVPYVPVEWVEGEWQPKRQSARKPEGKDEVA